MQSISLRMSSLKTFLSVIYQSSRSPQHPATKWSHLLRISSYQLLNILGSKREVKDDFKDTASYNVGCFRRRSQYSHLLRHSGQKAFANSCLFSSKLCDFNLSKRFNSTSTSSFSLLNTNFKSYIDSLVEEFQKLRSAENFNEVYEKNKNRISFLESVANVNVVLTEKYSELEELREFMTDDLDCDQEMKVMAEKDVLKLKVVIDDLEEELVSVLVGSNINDSSDIMLEVTSGVGGQEAMLFGAELFDMYTRYAAYKGWSVTGSNENTVNLGGIRKATVEISGYDVYRHFKHEAGVHRVQRVPRTESKGRVHTSTVTVAVLPKPKEVHIELERKDLKIEAMRSSGPGGQSVNTSNSACRVTHLPSGSIQECSDGRSHHENLEVAMKKLKMKIVQGQLDILEAERKAARKIQVGSGGRSEKVRTYNYKDDRISDHRLKGNLSNITEFLNGGASLDETIADLEETDTLVTMEYMLEDHRTKVKGQEKR